FSHFGSSLAYGMFQEGWDTPILSVAAPYESESYLLPHSGGAYQIPLDGLLQSSSDLKTRHKLAPQGTSVHNKKWVPVVANNLFGYAQTTWSPIAPLKDLLVISSPGPQSFPDLYDYVNNGYEDASGGAVTVFYKGEKIWSYKMLGYFMGQAGQKHFGSSVATGHLGASLLNVEALLMGSPEADTWYWDPDPGESFPQKREGFAYIVWLRGANVDGVTKELPKAYWELEKLNGKITVEAT